VLPKGIAHKEATALRDFEPVYVADGVKTSNAQNKEMFSGLPPNADMRDGMPDFRLGQNRL
jgi:hypothetical protein